MPPVLGPVSPSPTRLWSCAEASGSACAPSHSAKKLASSPVRNSSTTISAPAAPNRPPSAASTASYASASVAATTTPFPPGQRRGDAAPLPRRQPIRLDDDRRALCGDIGLGGSRVGKAAIGGGRD